MLQLPRWQIYGIVTVVIGAIFLLLPNLFPKDQVAHWPGFMPSQQINLGLDLRGGSHVVFKVDTDALVAEKLDNLQEEIRAKLRDQRIGYSDFRRQGDQIRLKLADPAQNDAAHSILRALTKPGVGAATAAPYEIGTDGGDITVTFTEAARADAAADAVRRSGEIFRKRLDEFGTTEPLIQAQGNDRIIVQLPGVSDPDTIIGLLGKTAKMTFHLVDDPNIEDAIKGRVPPGEQLLFEDRGDGQNRPVLIKKRVSVSGESLTDAQAQVNSQTGENAVSFKFDGEGTRKFGDVTRDNVGKRFAIVLDGKIISAPVIRSQILQGQGEISGGFTTFNDASNLAVLLRAGALPAKFTVIEKRTVGAELGADSIHAGITATVIASVAVIIFMIVAYGLFGVFADIAVIINVIIILAILSVFRSTLTLPGIAGIVLTVGMAVDSNVLIYERMKEELKAGKTPINALDAGFSRALGTILDANITTAIAALILFQLGAGPVRGFAVTHLIGTMTTVFTAFTMTRLMIALWTRATRPKRLPIDPRPHDGKKGAFRIIPEGFSFPFMKYRFIADAISLGGVLLSIGLFIALGLNYGIDFKGGVLLELHSQGPADVAKIRTVADGLGLGHAQVQQFGAPEDVLIRLESQEGGDEAQQAALAKVQGALKTSFGDTVKIVRTEVVGPTVGGELVFDGVKALAIAVVCMLGYVWFRFEWQFGVGAVAGLFHDIMLTIGVFALFRLEFSLTSIAALLTTIGYSMNDKVVIADRIRENLRKYKKLELKALIDQSLNETLSRTVMTAVTTLLALGSLYLFGGEVIRTFTLAMILGVIVGTYSSIYIAAPLLVLTGIKRDWSGLDTKPAGAKARPTA